MPTQDLRSLYLLRPDVIFLNHGSFGACPRPVFEAYQAWQLELERQPVEFLGRRHDELLAEARRALGAYVNADPDDLVFVPNATTGLNIIARSIPIGPNDEVLATDQEYGAMDRMWRFTCLQSGGRYVRQAVPLPIQDGTDILEAVWNGVNRNTHILFISHITSSTAIINPLKSLLACARDLGIITIVDGAHAPGQIPLNLRELGADFYVGNCHKWMMAPKGAAFLYARKEMQPLLDPLVVSWGWEPEKPGPSRFIDLHQYQGTRDISAYLSVPEAIRFMQEHNWPQVQQECHLLLRYARERITALTGLPPLTPDTPDYYAQMAAFPLPPCNAETLKQRLYDDYRIEVPIIKWNGQTLLRVSVQAYNTQADIDALIDALTVLL